MIVFSSFNNIRGPPLKPLNVTGAFPIKIIFYQYHVLTRRYIISMLWQIY